VGEAGGILNWVALVEIFNSQLDKSENCYFLAF